MAVLPMNTQKKYICCHRIVADGSDNPPLQVVSTHDSADWFIKRFRDAKGDNVLNHEWYIMKVQLDYLEGIKEHRMMTDLDNAWQHPIARLNCRDKAITWNEDHPLYAGPRHLTSQS